MNKCIIKNINGLIINDHIKIHKDIDELKDRKCHYKGVTSSKCQVCCVLIDGVECILPSAH